MSKHRLTKEQAERLGLREGDEVEVEALADMSEVHPDNRSKPYAKTVKRLGNLVARRFNLGN